MEGIILAVVGLLIMGIMLGRLRSRAFQRGLLHGRLQGMREAMDVFLGHCYELQEEGGGPLESVRKALDDMDRALKHETGIKGQITFYQIGISKLGSAVGRAVWHKGFDAGHRRMNPELDNPFP